MMDFLLFMVIFVFIPMLSGIVGGALWAIFWEWFVAFKIRRRWAKR